LQSITGNKFLTKRSHLLTYYFNSVFWSLFTFQQDSEPCTGHDWVTVSQYFRLHCSRHVAT